MDIDECSSNFCQNGGTCSDQVDRFVCTCAAGYSGNVCEIGRCELLWIGSGTESFCLCLKICFYLTIVLEEFR